MTGLASRYLDGPVDVRVWSPAARTGRLLLVHDGTAYENDARLLRWIRRCHADGVVPPFHVALLDAGDRSRWYAASPAYARALTREVLPSLRATYGVDQIVGLGASLGALSLLHAHRHRPGDFDGLFLQSGSFFTPAYDSQERGFAGWRPVTRFVRTVGNHGAGEPVPTVLTCGVNEENLANNRAMHDTLATRGYPVTLHEVPGGHNFDSWRAAVRTYLPPFLDDVWR